MMGKSFWLRPVVSIVHQCSDISHVLGVGVSPCPIDTGKDLVLLEPGDDVFDGHTNAIDLSIVPSLVPRECPLVPPPFHRLEDRSSKGGKVLRDTVIPPIQPGLYPRREETEDVVAFEDRVIMPVTRVDTP